MRASTAVPTKPSRPLACRGARFRVFSRFGRLNLCLLRRASQPMATASSLPYALALACLLAGLHDRHLLACLVPAFPGAMFISSRLEEL